MARRRALWIGVVTAVGLLAGAGRMMQGGHWASDVAFAGILMFWVAWGLHRRLVARGAPEGSPA